MEIKNDFNRGESKKIFSIFQMMIPQGKKPKKKLQLIECSTPSNDGTSSEFLK